MTKTLNPQSLPNSQSQVLDSLDSLLIPSEPPDIKNWFSSYVYEPPELDRDDFGGSCSFRGNDLAEEESYVEDSFKGKEGSSVGELGKLGKEGESIVEEKIASVGFDGCQNYVGNFEVSGNLRGNDWDNEESYVEDSFKGKEENLVVLDKFGEKGEVIVYEKVTSKGFDGCQNYVGDFEGSGSFRGNGWDEESYVEDSFKGKEENLVVLGKFGKKGEVNGDERAALKGFDGCQNNVGDFEGSGSFRGNSWVNDKSYVEDSFKAIEDNLVLRTKIGKEGEVIVEKVTAKKFDGCQNYVGDFEGSGSFGGNGWENEESYVEDSFKCKEENLVVLGTLGKEGEVLVDEKVAPKGFNGCQNSIGGNDANQVADSLDTPSLCSEPPDIKNWFSSYVYESPALGTSDEFRHSNFEESKIAQVDYNSKTNTKEKEGHVMERRITGKDDILVGGKVASAEFDRLHSSAEHSNHNQWYQGKHEANGKRSIPVVNDLPFKGIPQRAQNHEDNIIKDVEISSLRDEARRSKRKFALEGFHYPLDSSRSSEDTSKSQSPLINERIITENSFNVKAPGDNDNVASPRRNLDFTSTNINPSRTTDTSNDKGDRTDCGQNGFVSARKNISRKTNDENSVIRPHEFHFESLKDGQKVSSVGNKHGTLQRKALTDTTNTQPSDIDVVGITGKWRCPQRSKPNVGPPLKQLQLGRWVHRL